MRPRSLDEAVAIIDRLLGTIADQQARITALEARVAEQRAVSIEEDGIKAWLTERPFSEPPPSLPSA